MVMKLYSEKKVGGRKRGYRMGKKCRREEKESGDELLEKD